MALTARYLADKSALARLSDPVVQSRLRPMIEDGDVATCAIVDLEILYSSRSLQDYEDILEERASLDSVPITPDVLATSIDLQHELARRGQHRIPIPDLIISAAALGADLIVVHYDADFERLAEIGGANQQWIVPRGSI